MSTPYITVRLPKRRNENSKLLNLIISPSVALTSATLYTIPQEFSEKLGTEVS